MSAIVADELDSFHHFLIEKLKPGATRSSPEQVLDEWRSLHPDPEEVAAIRESLAAMHAGDRGVALEDFDREFRKKNGLCLVSRNPRSEFIVSAHPDCALSDGPTFPKRIRRVPPQK